MEDSALKPLSVANSNWLSLQTLKSNWIYLVIGLLVINTIALDGFFIFGTGKEKQSITSLPLVSNGTSQLSDSSCPQSCVAMINTIAVTPIPTSSKTSTSQAVTPTFTPTPTPTSAPTAAKEYFVPLGIGSGNAADWTVVPGIGATIDPASYGNIQSITFEVTVRIPTGNQTASVRLYNANSFQSIANSEMTMSGGTPTLLVSTPLSLPLGSASYQVQMKTQLQYPTYIDQARIHIKTY